MLKAVEDAKVLPARGKPFTKGEDVFRGDIPREASGLYQIGNLTGEDMPAYRVTSPCRPALRRS